MHEPTSWATFAGRRASHAVECVDLLATPDRLDEGGLWFVVADFEADPEAADGSGQAGRTRAAGTARAWRFADVEPAGGAQTAATSWRGPEPRAWRSSLDRDAYRAAVATVRDRIRAGDVYQVNVCRVLSAPLSASPGEDPVVDPVVEPDASALAARLAVGNPAPYAAAIHVPASSGLDPVWVVSASPELYLGLGPAGDGLALASGPIKGTARSVDGLTPKDRAENVMITDLVRNDLQRVCRPGSVEVTDLLGVEDHPGLVHLVSRVRGVLDDDVAGASDLWGQILRATFPPGSVSGAPKSSALRLIAELETEPRGPYCGAVGWIDADAGRAELAVGIRTFWWSDGVLRFGTGAGITWGSDPDAEWEETQLKAARLVGLASGSPGSGPDR